MLPFKRILWPTDFSEPSYLALEAVDELAGLCHSEVFLFHVIPPLPALPGSEFPSAFDVSLYQAELEKAAKKSMAASRAKMIAKDIRVHEIISQGGAAAEILRIAREKHIDLIVISRCGESGWKRVVFGSVAEKVTRHSPVPVLVVHASPDESK
jgi:nucleotide-binding universal stress UspA family protein